MLKRRCNLVPSKLNRFERKLLVVSVLPVATVYESDRPRLPFAVLKKKLQEIGNSPATFACALVVKFVWRPCLYKLMLLALIFGLGEANRNPSPKFFPDDPLEIMPIPVSV